jgi:hypothetical protein
VPAGQLAQTLDPSTAAKVPAAQLAHVVIPALEYVPAAQIVHTVAPVEG